MLSYYLTLNPRKNVIDIILIHTSTNSAFSIYDGLKNTYFFLTNWADPNYPVFILLHLLKDFTCIMASFAMYYASKSSIRLFDLWEHS